MDLVSYKLGVESLGLTNVEVAFVEVDRRIEFVEVLSDISCELSKFSRNFDLVLRRTSLMTRGFFDLLPSTKVFFSRGGSCLSPEGCMF